MPLPCGKCCLHQDRVAALVASSKSARPPKVVLLMAHSKVSASPPQELPLDHVFITATNSNSSAAHCVEGLQMQGDMLAVWSLHDVRVYRLYGSTTPPSLLTSLAVPKPIVALAIHSRALFVALAGENKVDVYHDLPAKSVSNAGAGGAAAAGGAVTSSTALPFSAKEGRPLFLDIQGHVLAVATDKRVLKLFSLDKSGLPQQRSSAGQLVLPEEVKEKVGEEEEEEGKGMTLTSMHLNADATRVSFVLTLISSSYYIPARLCIYDVDRDVASAVSCLPAAAAAATSPTTHTWDAEDPKLLVCLCNTSKTSNSTTTAQPICSKKTEGKKEEGKEDGGIVVTLLVSPDEAQVTCLDSFPLCPPLGELIGVQAPHLYFCASSSSSPSFSSSLPSSLVLKRTMRDFVGLEYDSLTPTAQAALKAFHYHLLTQDWHAAHQALKLLCLRQQQQQRQGGKGREGGDGGSTAHEQQQQQQEQQQQLVCVWRNMARLCLQTRRVDVAELCLGHMGHVRGLTAVREAASTPSAWPSLPPSSSTDVALAMVAIQLGLLKEAAVLYTQAKRFDLLNRMYQAAGQWEEALRVAETEDRLHLRTTHFEYARQLEGVGEWEKAIGHYEEAGAQTREVPRMLLKVGKVVELEEYVKKGKDKGGKQEGIGKEEEEEEGRAALWQWWGRYCESKGDMKGAKEAYEEASDLVALVRLACVTQDVAAAEALLEEETTTRKTTPLEKHHPLKKMPAAAVKRAASYHLARHYEGALHDVLPALTHYARAGCFQHCLRLAMAHELDGDVMQFALQSDREQLMRQSARYFAERGQEERARELLDKAEGKAREGSRVQDT